MLCFVISVVFQIIRCYCYRPEATEMSCLYVEEQSRYQTLLFLLCYVPDVLSVTSPGCFSLQVSQCQHHKLHHLLERRHGLQRSHTQTPVRRDEWPNPLSLALKCKRVKPICLVSLLLILHLFPCGNVIFLSGLIWWIITI